ncbi:MAG: HEAT repeat domain-containing protein, partial [Planctomycetaceae bacterium]|nr:HEAT repeat domain-containing protein [Planctomycetaceae bacterium]
VELAAQLASSNGTVRDLVHQLLVWRDAKDAAEVIRDVLRGNSNPAVQIQSLAVLDGLRMLTDKDLMLAMQSESVDVRRFAVRLCEPFLNESPELTVMVVELASSSSARLRRQAALSLGVSETPQAADVLADLLTNQERSAAVRAAALNSVMSNNLKSVFVAYAAKPVAERNAGMWQRLLQLALQNGDQQLVRDVVNSSLPREEELSPVVTTEWLIAFNALDTRAAAGQGVDQLDGIEEAEAILTLAVRTLQNPAASESRLASAFQLLGRGFGSYSRLAASHSRLADQLSDEKRVELLSQFLAPRFGPALQQAALQAVADVRIDAGLTQILSAWPSMNAELRSESLRLVLSTASGQKKLLQAISDGLIRADALDSSQRDALLSSTNDAVRVLAEKVLGGPLDSNRTAVVEAMRAALPAVGSLDRGRDVFRKRCSVCHQLENHGFVVGPDLGALTNRDPAWLLTAILDPNRDVDGRYMAWTAVTVEGAIATGMIVEETATSIRLRESGGKEHLIARAELEEFRSAQKSVMPEGLERDVSPQDLCDVIAYLAGMEPPAKQLEGNTPQVVRVDSDGSLRLTANVAEIRGTEITFEAPFGNIGYWHHPQDSAKWRVDVPRAGEYDIYLDASCADSAAGNEYRIDGFESSIIGRMTGTGGWDRYRQAKIGTARLPAGLQSISIRSKAEIQQALFDLREVRLVPAGQATKFEMPATSDSALPRYPGDIAPFLLDESNAQEQRILVIDQRPGMGPGIISLLTANLKPDDEVEEYRRIPWIWRVAIAVGKRNDGGEIRDTLEICVPRVEAPLRDWQAVVIGGGLINGLSQLGIQPGPRLQEILKGLPAVQQAWPSLLQ